MNRRLFLKTMRNSSLFMAASFSWSNPLKKSPNLLVIHTDQQSCWTISAYGAKDISTPHIDSLAKEGAMWVNFFTNSAVCTPSRGCFLTGRYPHAHGAYKNNLPMNLDEITFASVLKENGYDTGYAGKWHLDGKRKPGWVHEERNFGFTDNFYMFNRGHWKKMTDSPISEISPNVFPPKQIGDEKSFTTDWLVDKTIDFINRPRKSPFCYMVSIPDPHTPFTVRGPYNTMFAPQKMTFPKSVPPKMKPKLRKQKAQYLGQVKCIDDNVGRIIRTLKDNGIYDDTIVVFTTDHGEYMGEHGLMHKNQIYETAIRIPFIIRWPQKIAKGTELNQIFSTIDFLPTIVSLMGFATNGREQGKSASLLFMGKKTRWENVAHVHHSSLERAHIFTQEFEMAYTDSGKNGFLFDRKNDPDQTTNLFEKSDYKHVVFDLSKKIVEHHKKVNSPAWEWLKLLSN
jgi:arylsulfatase A-like enzyme